MGLRIREYRKARGLSLIEVCALLAQEGVILKKSALAHKERGETSITMTELKALARVLKTPWRTLANGVRPSEIILGGCRGRGHLPTTEVPHV